MGKLSTGGFDFTIQISEEFLNKLLVGAYYNGKFPVKKLFKNFSLPNIPPFDSWVEIQYRGVPVVQFRNRILELTLFNYVKIKIKDEKDINIDVSFVIAAEPKFETKTRDLYIDLDASSVKIYFDKKSFDLTTSKNVEAILSFLINEYINREIKKIGFSWQAIPLKIPTVDIPFIFSVGNMQVTDDFLGAYFNFLNYQGGDISQVSDMTGGKYVSFGLSEGGIGRFLDWFWNNTKLPKEIHSQSSNQMHRGSLKENLIISFVDDSVKNSWNGFWLGIIRYRLEYIDTKLHSIVKLSKPNIDIIPGGKIQISGSFKVEFKIRADGIFVPRRKWARKILPKKKHRIFYFETGYLKFDLKKVVVGVDMSSEQTLKPHIYALSSNNVEIDKFPAKFYTLPIFSAYFLGMHIATLAVAAGAVPNVWVDFIIDYFIKDFKDEFNKNPPFYLSQPIYSKEIAASKLEFNANIVNIDSTDEEIVLQGDAKIEGGQYQLSEDNYILLKNTSPTKKELHRRGCPWIRLISPSNKVYACFADEELGKFGPCDKCFGG